MIPSSEVFKPLPTSDAVASAIARKLPSKAYWTFPDTSGAIGSPSQNVFGAEVINGICYVHIWGWSVNNGYVGYNRALNYNALPPKASECGVMCRVMDNGTHVADLFLNTGVNAANEHPTLMGSFFATGKAMYASFSYPVNLDWQP